MEQARDRAAIAREVLATGHLEGAVSAAYYAMLYAARAALSEDDAHARTHRRTWHLFHERYAATDVFDQHLHALAQRAQDAREKGDHEAVTPDRDEADAIVSSAADFIAAVERMLEL